MLGANDDVEALFKQRVTHDKALHIVGAQAADDIALILDNAVLLHDDLEHGAHEALDLVFNEGELHLPLSESIQDGLGQVYSVARLEQLRADREHIVDVLIVRGELLTQTGHDLLHTLMVQESEHLAEFALNRLELDHSLIEGIVQAVLTRDGLL